MLTRLLVCGAMGAARLAELAYSRSNVARSGPTREGRLSRTTYPLMVLLHTSVLVTTALRGSRHARRDWLALVLLAQLMRWWVVVLLGPRWNTRGAVPEAMAVETRGPYAYVRHPNYAVVLIELWALPLAFRLPGVAGVATLMNAGLLGVRIRDEEAAMMQLPGYREQFASKARLVPRVF